MKTIEKCFLFGVLMTILLNLTVFSSRCENINNKVFRLHILANSDSEEDQSLKLKVRDAILKETSTLFENPQNKNEAIDVSRENIEMIKDVAKREVHKNGYDYDVDVQIVNMHFNTRVYGNVTMPAGNYDALRVLIGEAKGHNWWCVMFPAMCVSAAEEKQELSDVLTDSEMDLALGENQYSVQFKVVEYFEAIKNFFQMC